MWLGPPLHDAGMELFNFCFFTPQQLAAIFTTLAQSLVNVKLVQKARSIQYLT